MNPRLRPPPLRSGHRPSGKLVLAGDQALRAALVGALGDVLAYGSGAAAQAPRRPTLAVHELRKSLRRARALVALTRPLLRGHSAEAIAAALRETQAATSALRDTDVMLAIVAGVGDQLRLTPPARRVLAALAADLRRTQRHTRAGGQVAQAIGRSTARLEGLPARYARALAAEVQWRDLELGLRNAYRRVRHLHQSARRHGHDDQRFHDWRKAVKALNYQLELVASARGKPAEKARRRFADLAEAQGAVTDLMVLRERLAARAPAHPDPATTRLLARLEELIKERRREVVRAGKRVLDRSPRHFTARMF